jgi:hypothetical protein
MKAALIEQPELLEVIKTIFNARIDKSSHAPRPFGQGNSKWAYEVGLCPIAESQNVSVILKISSEKRRLAKYGDAVRRGAYSAWNEFGTFELFYDYVAGHIDKVSFRSRAGFERYKREVYWNHSPKFEFTLSEGWGGTRVKRGDLGAMPYFQLAVRYRGRYGILTEGLPPLIEPKYTARTEDQDEYTVEDGRLIDLDRVNCHLPTMDQGGSHLRYNQRHPNLLGIYKRGEKYFKKANRLDLTR